MRLLIVVMVLLLLVSVLGFTAENLHTYVPVTLWGTAYSDVHVSVVVIAAVFAGVLFAAVFGIAEGTKTRFENRRLRRELHKLETEINYLRTQPPPAPRPEPDALDSARARARPAAEERSAHTGPPSAPVYGTDKDDWGPDSDDDIYTGGRAV